MLVYYKRTEGSVVYLRSRLVSGDEEVGFGHVGYTKGLTAGTRFQNDPADSSAG